MLKNFKLLFILVFAVFVFSLKPHSALAVSATDWQAGRIIDDVVFANKNDVSVDQIQTFLNATVGTGANGKVAGQCDTNGSAVSELGGGTRANFGANNNNPIPFTCLKDYYEVPKTTPGPGVPASNYGGAPIPVGAKSAAQLIWDAAQAYNINPKVLLVTIQKESIGPLTTDDWPFKKQYTYAMGAHCPDSGPGGSANCDPNYAGFSIQISESAALLRYYLDNMNQPWWPYKHLGNNPILFNPNSANCGSSNVNIQTMATAALYTYTPYQPNQAALNNLYGLGDGCSAYGNRNFWRIYNDWFGPTSSLASVVTMRNISQPDTTPALGQTISYTFSLTNNSSVSLTINAVGVIGRLGDVNSGANRDLGWQGPVTLAAGATQSFTFTSVISDMGTIYLWPAINAQGIYTHYNNWGTAINTHIPNFSLTPPLTSSINNPVASQTTTLSATIKNNEDQPIKLDALGIPVRYYGQYNYDATWASSVTIQPGAKKDLSGIVPLDKAGPYNAWISGLFGGQYVTFSPQLNLSVLTPTPNFQLSYTQTPDTTPALGEDVAIKFKLKNNSGIPMTLNAVGVVGRYDNPYTGANKDFGWVGPEIFGVGEEKSYTAFATNISDLRNFYTWVAINYQGSYIHYNNWGFLMTPHIPNLTISAPLTVSGGTQPTLGQTEPVTVTIKNNESSPIRFSAIGIPVRYYGVYNYDTAWQGVGTLAALGQSNDSISLSGSVKFDKTGPYMIWASINIQGKYITIGNPKTIGL